jgi:heavy metal translocating P-type ATPase
MQFLVRHSIPGRIRLYVPGIRVDPTLETLLSTWFLKQTGIICVRVNGACASIVIEYRTEITTCLRQLGRATWNELRSAQPTPGLSQTNGIVRSEKPQPNGSLLYATVSLALSLVQIPLGAVLNLPLIIWNALPSARRASVVLVREHRLNVDFLDGLAIAIALSQGQFFTAAFMVWLISLGDWIRNRTAAKSRRAVADLLEFQTHSAWVLRGEEVVQVRATEVKPAETVMIYAGDMIPVDGDVSSGAASVDQKMMTGESMPVVRNKGDHVYAGTIVRDGKLRVIASRVGLDTAAGQIVSLIENAPVTETRVQNYAEKFADRLVAPWLAVSLGVFGATQNVERLLSMAIIDYGTGIRVAAPTSILACMAAAAREGILIKGGSQMEKLAQADTMIFDKTGTLTRGTPHVVDVLSYNKRIFPKSKILEIAAAVEARVRHPIAEAIVAKAKEAKLTIPDRSDSKYQIGMGVEAQVNGYYVHLGSRRFLQANGVKVTRAQADVNRLDHSGCSTLVMAVDGKLVGAVACADQIRPESRDVIAAVHHAGIKNVMMITGDTEATARTVSGELGIDRVFAETMPEDKASIIKGLQNKGRTVVMVGDGINDSPALAYADVGIAMKNGADIARESADVVLMEDNLWKLPSALEFSHRAMRLVRQNYQIIVGFNTLAIVLALPTGFVSAGLIAAISNGSAILASLNAIRPLI